MTRPFAIDVGWAALLDPLGIDPNDLLRAAALPPIFSAASVPRSIRRVSSVFGAR